MSTKRVFKYLILIRNQNKNLTKKLKLINCFAFILIDLGKAIKNSY